MKMGIVELDTSHPAAWIPIERTLGHQITEVFDSGSVHPPGYAQRFASEHQIPKVFASRDEIVSQVECATIPTERSVAQCVADNSTLYRSMLQIVLPYLAGEAEAPMTPQEWLEPELCAVAAQRSWQNNDCEAALCELTDADGYDGKAFAE